MEKYGRNRKNHEEEWKEEDGQQRLEEIRNFQLHLDHLIDREEKKEDRDEDMKARVDILEKKVAYLKRNLNEKEGIEGSPSAPPQIKL